MSGGGFGKSGGNPIVAVRPEALDASVLEAARIAAGEKALVSCRITHAYPDGAAPYFTVITPARIGSELAQWQELKTAITDAMLAAGGTTTHHHAVGRDFRPWYERQSSPLVLASLGAVKRELDPGAGPSLVLRYFHNPEHLAAYELRCGLATLTPRLRAHATGAFAALRDQMMGGPPDRDDGGPGA